MKLANPWNDVYKQQGYVFKDPYSGFSNYVQKLAQLHSKVVLDLGCGTGRHAVPLATLGYDVHAFDISSSGVDLLDRLANTAHLGEGQIKAIIADMFEPFPYQDKFFDSVIAIAVIYHGTLYNVAKTIKEIARVLKPGGLFYFTTSFSLDISKKVNHGSEYILIEPGTYLPMDGREKYLVHHYFTKEELFEILSADFDTISVSLDDTNSYYEIYCYKK